MDFLDFFPRVCWGVKNMCKKFQEFAKKIDDLRRNYMQGSLRLFRPMGCRDVLGRVGTRREPTIITIAMHYRNKFDGKCNSVRHKPYQARTKPNQH